MKWKAGILIIIVGISFSGCAKLFNMRSVRSESFASDPSPGLAYWLPTSAFRVKLVVQQVKQQLVVSLSATPESVPDTSAGLQFLRHDTSMFYADKIDLRVDKHGLLSNVNAEVEDKTGEIIVTIVKIAANVAKIAAGLPVPGARMAAVHPTLEDQLRKLLGTHEWVATLSGFPGGSTIPVLAGGGGGGATIQFSATALGTAPVCSTQHVCDTSANPVLYRVAVPHAIKLDLSVSYGNPAAPSSWSHQSASIASVPAPAVFGLPFERVDFVRSVKKATFDAGVLRGIDIDRPSPMLGFLEIPLEITERLLQLPGELLKIRLESTQDQAAILESQVKMLEAGQKLQQQPSPTP